MLAAADLVVARAGGSVMEIAAAGRPAILVPYPHATADHQTTNARWMAEGGAAVVIPDAELTAERLSGAIAELLDDEDRLARDGGSRRAGSPSRTPPSGSPARSWRPRVVADEWRAAGCTSSRSAAPA